MSRGRSPLTQESDHIWNFAYGSNMHPERRATRAKLSPFELTPAVLREWRLAFNIPGVPLLEPAMASILPARGRTVHGVLLKLSRQDFARLEQSEGGDSFYKQVTLEVEAYDGRRISARVFKAAPALEFPETAPSRRYLTLLRDGARESGLDPEYRAWLEGLPHATDNQLTRTLGPMFLKAFMWASQGPLRGVAHRYLRALQETERVLSPSTRRVAQAAMLAPGVALGLGLSARQACARRCGAPED